MTTRPEDMVLLTTCANEMEAELIASSLRDQGVAAAAVGIIPATVLGPYTGNNDPARVVVRRDQLDDARRLLDDYAAAPIPFEFEHASLEEEPPPSRDNSVMRIGRTYIAITLGSFIGFLIVGVLSYVPFPGNRDPNGAGWILVPTLAMVFIMTSIIVMMCVTIVRFLTSLGSRSRLGRPTDSVPGAAPQSDAHHAP